MAKKAESAVPIPGLYVRDFGPLGLPLSERDARALEKLSAGAQDECSNPRVLTWGTEEVQFHNPEWYNFINGLTAEISKGLDVATEGTTMKLQFNKMLLQGKHALLEKREK